jgi:hypothetical protein
MHAGRWLAGVEFKDHSRTYLPRELADICDRPSRRRFCLEDSQDCFVRDYV